MPGIMIAGTHSGCGKTTVTLGILAALKRRGLEIQAFKTGPDFIDTGLMGAITGRPARNLDLWMCRGDYVLDCFTGSALGADLAVVEGVMGLYDGEAGSAALASFLGIPVILVVDAYGLAESAGAIAQGYAAYEPPGGFNYPKPVIAGVIFNRVGSPEHFARLKRAVKDLPVFGYLPRDRDFSIPERYLGLTVAEEEPLGAEMIACLAAAVAEYLDLEGIVGLASGGTKKPVTRRAGAREGGSRAGACPGGPPAGMKTAGPVKIAYFYDRAFSFYYEDNLLLLKAAGADLIPFSPLEQDSLPRGISGLYLGGGYPELSARRLTKREKLLAEIRRLAEGGLAIYAECGGLIYLSQGVFDLAGEFHPLAGVLPFATRMSNRLIRLGYREVTLKEDCLLGERGQRLRGHEYHYSEIDREGAGEGNLRYIYQVAGKNGQAGADEGYLKRNVLASYIHVHFGSSPQAAAHFVRKVRLSPWKT